MEEMAPTRPIKPTEFDRADPRRLLRTSLSSLDLRTPVVIASGVFGYGQEYMRVDGFNFETVGAITLKGVTLQARTGNPSPRIHETPSGMLNSIGLSNVGTERLIKEELPALEGFGPKVIVNVGGETANDVIDAARALCYHQDKFAALELRRPPQRDLVS